MTKGNQQEHKAKRKYNNLSSKYHHSRKISKVLGISYSKASYELSWSTN